MQPTTLAMPEPDLQKRLEQVGRRLVEEVEAWERSTRDHRREAVAQLTTHITQQISHAIEKKRKSEEERRAERRTQRAQRRAERRAREREEASVFSGVAMVTAALALAAFAVLRPDLWWLVFVALGVGLGGAKQLGLVSERRRMALPSSTSTDPTLEPGAQPAARTAETHEVDALCDQLLNDLARAPEAVRRFVQAPEKTIASLRATAKALDSRRLQLLAERPRERLAELETQARTLEGRLASATDEVTRAKLAEALKSLRAQRGALEQLATHADRVDGEYTSLLVSLQELRLRVSLARTAGSTIQLDGVKASVERLGAELEAISSALESVSSGRLAPVAPVSAEPDATSSRDVRERV